MKKKRKKKNLHFASALFSKDMLRMVKGFTPWILFDYFKEKFYIHWSAGRSPRVHEVNPGRDPSASRGRGRRGRPRGTGQAPPVFDK